jgi:NAD(P)-dependent dehydrogenase (short-subunit alcohol dehydrogenase family)
MTRTIVITGTSSGFGKLCVERFAAEGWNVIATVRKDSDLAVHGDLPGVRTLLLNVDDEQADLAFADLAARQFGRIDALVNNAGYYQAGPLEGTTMDQVHRQFQTNVFGLIALNKAFIPRFREQGCGVIVNIGSISADQGYPYTSVYEASKAAVVSLSEGLNAELAEFGIIVKAVLPGSMDTRIFSKMDLSENTPAAYEASIKAFYSLDLFQARSHPRVTADVIYQAVTDGDATQVRYYTGPDGTAIPRVKQLLGQDWYWQEFRALVGGKPSPLWRTLVPAAEAAGRQ